MQRHDALFGPDHFEDLAGFRPREVVMVAQTAEDRVLGLSGPIALRTSAALPRSSEFMKKSTMASAEAWVTPGLEGVEAQPSGR